MSILGQGLPRVSIGRYAERKVFGLRANALGNGSSRLKRTRKTGPIEGDTMHIQQHTIAAETVTAADLAPIAACQPHLVLVFASLEAMQQLDAALLNQAVPGAQWVGCSTAGEIANQGVADHTVVLTAVRFHNPAFRVVTEVLHSMADSHAAGQRLGDKLAGADLRHVLVLGQGAGINGSALVSGMAERLGLGVAITGGLAGDGGRFTGARVLGPTGVGADTLVAIGFDGPTWRIGHGSLGGWQPFGPIRRVTESRGNVLVSLDGERALDIYKRYLGDYAAQLPGSGLLFPWSVVNPDAAAGERGVVRTLLGVDEAEGSLVLAGDIPPGGHLQLMHASVDALVDAAEQAAEAAVGVQSQGASTQDAAIGQTLAVLVSCVGRKLVMGSRVDEEVEAVVDVLGRSAMVTGFYSNGEICPNLPGTACHLHNQTMTITLLQETAP